jgi:hypothetical protein
MAGMFMAQSFASIISQPSFHLCYLFHPCDPWPAQSNGRAGAPLKAGPGLATENKKDGRLPCGGAAIFV